MSFFGNTSLFSTNSATPLFGSTANKPAGLAFNTTTSAPSFGFGTATTSTGFSGFGTTQSSGFGSFGGFGATNPTTTATGFGSFGTTGTAVSAPAPAGGFSFGGTTSTAPAGGFSFGGTPTTSSGFGSFGGFGTTNTSTAGTGLFGGGLGQSGANTTGFGGFGLNFGAGKSSFNFTTPGFGQAQQQQPQQQAVVDPSLALYNSIFNCQVFGDERDTILGRWNLLQALWGVGKGFYNQQAPPVEYDMKNPFCRFKAIAYSERPKYENKDGLVALVINKKESELRPLEPQIVNSLVSILGNKPNLAPVIESMRAISESKTLVVISVQEKTVTGAVRKIAANELASFFLQPMQKQQLTNLQVENLYPQVEVPPEQLREYLDTPPAGIDAQAWQQAQEDNPMPGRLIPVPLVGFGEVRWRMKCQETESGLQQAFLNKMADEVADLQRKHNAIVANISEYKSRLIELQHRILKLLILQEKSRKMGMSLLPEEEVLNSRLEALTNTLNSTTFKNRLSDLTEGVKSLTESNKEPQRYKMDGSVVSEIKQFLTMEQTGMSHVIETIQADTAELKIIKDGMMRLLQGHV